MTYLINLGLALTILAGLAIVVAMTINYMITPTFIFMDAKTGNIFETRKAFHQLPEEQQVKRFVYLGIL